MCVVVLPPAPIRMLFSIVIHRQTVRNSDIYSINCQLHQHQYVKTLRSNTTNTAETETDVYLTRLLKYSLVVRLKSKCSMFNWLWHFCQCKGLTVPQLSYLVSLFSLVINFVERMLSNNIMLQVI